MAQTVENILSSSSKPENMSERVVRVLKRAREEAISKGKTKFIEPTHLLSAMVSNGVQGISSSIIAGYINGKYLLQFRQMLSENISMRYDHLSEENLNDPGFMKLWNILMYRLEDDEMDEANAEDLVYSKEIDRVLKRAEEIAHELGNKDFDSGELLAAILDVCKDDFRIKLFVKKTGITYESVLESLRDRDRESYFRKAEAVEQAHSFNL